MTLTFNKVTRAKIIWLSNTDHQEIHAARLWTIIGYIVGDNTGLVKTLATTEIGWECEESILA